MWWIPSLSGPCFLCDGFFASQFRESIKPSSSLLFHIPQSIQSCLWNSARIQIWEDSTTCFVTMLQDALKMLSRWIEILWQKASGGSPLCLRHARGLWHDLQWWWCGLRCFWRRRSSRDPEKEVGSSQRKPSTGCILQAVCCLACFGCIFLSERSTVSVEFLGICENTSCGILCPSHYLLNHWDPKSGDEPHLSQFQKTKKNKKQKNKRFWDHVSTPICLWNLFFVFIGFGDPNPSPVAYP